MGIYFALTDIATGRAKTLRQTAGTLLSGFNALVEALYLIKAAAEEAKALFAGANNNSQSLQAVPQNSPSEIPAPPESANADNHGTPLPSKTLY